MPPSGKHGYCDSNSRVPQVKQKIPAIDEVDIAVVGVSPARRPSLRYFEIVAAVGEVRSASDYLDVTDGKVVFPSKVRAKMFVVNSTGMLVALCIIVPLFLSNFFVVSMLVLGKGGDQSPEKQPSADGSNRYESFHVRPRFIWSQNAGAPSAFVTTSG
jgi:hypothetical protein